MYFSRLYKKKNPFDIHPINLYLHEKIKASPLDYFDNTKNEVVVRLHSIDYGILFLFLETL